MSYDSNKKNNKLDPEEQRNVNAIKCLLVKQEKCDCIEDKLEGCIELFNYIIENKHILSNPKFSCFAEAVKRKIIDLRTQGGDTHQTRVLQFFHNMEYKLGFVNTCKCVCMTNKGTPCKRTSIKHRIGKNVPTMCTQHYKYMMQRLEVLDTVLPPPIALLVYDYTV